jgi:hypothetical protein
MIRITPQHIYALRNSTGKPFTDLLDRLIRSSAAILGIPPSDVLDNPRINYRDGGVDTQVNKGAQEGPWDYFKGPTTWQYKAVELDQAQIISSPNSAQICVRVDVAFVGAQGR